MAGEYYLGQQYPAQSGYASSTSTSSTTTTVPPDLRDQPTLKLDLGKPDIAGVDRQL